MTRGEAIAFVKKHGVVLEAGRGPVPSLAGTIAGEPIHGSWWAHPKGREIFALTRALRDSDDILVCRLVGAKITFVHRRLWPALVRLAPALDAARLARLEETHTASGRHVVRETRYPRWVPAEVRDAARLLSMDEARARLGPALAAVTKRRPGSRMR